MQLDVRLPIGLMFLLFGLMLSVYGLLTRGDNELYQRSLGLNVNLGWGLVLLIFGAVMLLLTWRGRKTADAEPKPQGGVPRPPGPRY